MQTAPHAGLKSEVQYLGVGKDLVQIVTVFLSGVLFYRRYLSLGFIAVKSHHNHRNFYKHLIVVAAYRGSVHYHHDKEHGSVQADVVLATS